MLSSTWGRTAKKEENWAVILIWELKITLIICPKSRFITIEYNLILGTKYKSIQSNDLEKRKLLIKISQIQADWIILPCVADGSYLLKGFLYS